MNPAKTIIINSAVTMAGLLTLSAAEGEIQASRPNIIHIMVDDLGWRDLSIYGSETFHTPNIDALAARGIRYSNAYAASPLCSPTRASVLTGQTVGRVRFTSPTGHLAEVVLDPQESATGGPGYPMTNPGTRSRLPLESTTISQVLKDNGYRTALMGKWHLGHDPYIPENFGFDVVIGGRGTPGPPAPGFFGPWPAVSNLPQVEGSPNVDDVLGDEAVKFIAGNADDPFFLALWLYNVHAPFQGKPEDIEAYRPFAESAWYQRSAIMGSMVKTLDDNVGKVMAELEKQGLLENTIVIFTSDNGGNMYDRPEGENPTSNNPLRAGKGNNYEGGIRIPLIVSWPGQIEFNTVTDVVNISYDFFPTVLDILDIPAPEGWPLDGKSALPAWRGEPFERGPVYTVFPHSVLATGNVSNVAMIDGKWKLMRFFNTGINQEDEYELYDLSIDPGETHNLAAVFPGLTNQMATEMAQHLEETRTLLPRKNPNYNPDLIQGGFQMVKGGFMAGASQTDASITAKDHRVTLHYHVAGQSAPGNVLEFDFLSNCVVGITAGPGILPIFGKPALTIPDLESRKIRVPLNAVVSDGVITVVLDLEQPGRMHISNPRLVMMPFDLDSQVGDHEPPRVTGVYGYWENQTLHILWNDKIWPDLEWVWDDWSGYSHFEIQLSKDGMDWDQTFSSGFNQQSMTSVIASTYRVRVRAISKNEQQGPWSEIHTIELDAHEYDYELEPQYLSMDADPSLTNRVTIRFRNPVMEIDMNQLTVTVSGDGSFLSTEPLNRAAIEKFWPMHSLTEVTGMNKLDDLVIADGLLHATVSPITPIDPFFFFTNSTLDGSALPYVSFRLYTDQTTTGQLYWFFSGGHKSTSYPMESGWKIYSFNNMPDWVANKNITRVRLDPGTTNASSKIMLDWMAISSRPLSNVMQASPAIQGNTATILTSPTANPGSYTVSVNYGDIHQEIVVNTAATHTEAISSKEPKLLLYPNPASDVLTVSTAGSFPVALSIVSLDGRILLQKELTGSDSHNISVHHLKSGLYIVKIISLGRLYTRKLIIQRKL